jgi:hypothetical protein
MGSKESKPRPIASRLLRDRLARIAACEKSGKSLKAYAEEHGLSVHMLYQAKKVARERGMIAPHPHRTKRIRTRRPSSAPAKFVEAIAKPREVSVGVAWRLRMNSGDVLEGASPLVADDLSPRRGI